MVHDGFDLNVGRFKRIKVVRKICVNPVALFNHQNEPQKKASYFSKLIQIDIPSWYLPTFIILQKYLSRNLLFYNTDRKYKWNVSGGNTYYLQNEILMYVVNIILFWEQSNSSFSHITQTESKPTTALSVACFWAILGRFRHLSHK